MKEAHETDDSPRPGRNHRRLPAFLIIAAGMSFLPDDLSKRPPSWHTGPGRGNPHTKPGKP